MALMSYIECVVSMCIHIYNLYIKLLLQHMRSTNSMKAHHLTAYSYMSNELVNPNCECFNIGYH